VGDSLARGLGVFGAMAIIRFRTRVDDPRNVLFLFAALSSGLAVGVYGFTVSLAGSVVFCLGAIILHFTSFRYSSHSHTVEVRFSGPPAGPQVEKCLQDYCYEFRLASVTSVKDGEVRYEYTVSLKRSKNELADALMALDVAKRIQVKPVEFQPVG